MNWEAIAALSQLIGSIGLFLSIIYLALQVRQGTAMARVTAAQAATATFRDVILPIAQDPELDRIWRTGLADFRNLSPDDQSRFFHLAFQAIKGAEAVYSSYTDKVMDAATWKGWNHIFVQYLTAPGLRAYWELRRDAFSEPFNRVVDSLPAPTPTGRVAGIHAPKSSGVDRT
jgi:hypothetical protein